MIKEFIDPRIENSGEYNRLSEVTTENPDLVPANAVERYHIIHEPKYAVTENALL